MTQGSLFDGFGGLRRGLEDAGLVSKWALDLIYGHDIATTNPDSLERVDLISGGPPCQRGSIAARFSRSRTQITLWPEMLRIVKGIRPNWVVVENVLGFQRQMVDWTADLHELGYGCAGQLVDSRHWVPQQRTRCFIVGRMGADGMALWNHLYADRKRMEGRKQPQELQESRQGGKYAGSCPDCVRDGVFARLSARKPACMGAGNAVTQPLAAWLGQRIIETEKCWSRA